MSLSQSKMREMPPDAVILTEEEALKYQIHLIKNWEDRSDTFSFRYGVFTLSLSGFMTGVYLNNHYRRKLKLGSYGKIATFLPLCMLPGIFSAFMHAEFVMKAILLQKQDACPICLQTRASAIQVMIGCVFPALLTPVATFSIAHRYGTYNLPDVATKMKDTLLLIKKIKTPILGVLYGMILAHAALASTITYLEAKSIYTVHNKLLKQEQEIENNSFN